MSTKFACFQSASLHRHSVMHQPWLKAAVLLALSCAALLGLRAQAATYTTDDEGFDPANRVARVSYLQGDVYVQPNDANAWTDAQLNRPLTSGDQLWTASRGRSELQVGSTAVQLSDSTQLKLLELSDEVLQLQLTNGTVNVYVRSLDKGDTVEIDTPNAAITMLEAGTYRIDVDEDSTVVQVRDGSVDATGQRQSFTVESDEQLTLRGDRRLSANYDDVSRLDEFDRWAQDRNDRARRASATRYVSSDVIGYEDLDDYGYWRWTADYGYVWTPNRIAGDWAPYRYGHWIWIAPWGWTWVDESPWGFAPFHYGRWTQISNRWCWVPGPRTNRAVYAPALVAWIGAPGVSVSINIGTPSVGWVPLGPREVYRPIYRASQRYVLNVNLSNSRLNQEEFERGYRRDARDVSYGNRGAASVVPADAFGKARPVNNNLLRVDPSRLQVNDQKPNITPDRSAIMGNERERATPARGIEAERSVVVKRQPQPISRPVEQNNGQGVRVVPPTTVINQSTTTPRVATPPTQRIERDISTPVITPNRNGGTTRTEREQSAPQPQSANETRSGRSTVTTPYIRQGNRDNGISTPAATPIPTPTPAPVTTPATRDTPRFTVPERSESRPVSSERNQSAPIIRTPQPETQQPSAPTTATPATTEEMLQKARQRGRGNREQDIR